MSIINLAQLPLTQNIYGFRKKKKTRVKKNESANFISNVPS